ncbi:MAG: deoxyribose-phosphate aldolase [Spirochaetota bacterium]
MDNIKLAKMIDHTLLKPESTKESVKKVCDEAKTHNFASVCINPCWVSFVAKELKQSDVKVCTVIGFPLGATHSEVKAYETAKAISEGAEEIDMVINIGAVKSADWNFVEKDIKAVVNETKDKALVKVILETCLLNDEEIIKACEISMRGGADFVKTSTGFSKGGATIGAVKLMRKTVGLDFGVKASGGIRDRKTALQMIEAGATRLGASSGVKILADEKSNEDY